MADRVVRNGIREGLGVSVAFTSMVCPFLYTVKVMGEDNSPSELIWVLFWL